MKLWSLHPSYFNAKRLVPLRREGLLAQKVLAGLTKCYRHPPQLTRFYHQTDTQGAIATYLREVQEDWEVR